MNDVTDNLGTRDFAFALLRTQDIGPAECFGNMVIFLSFNAGKLKSLILHTQGALMLYWIKTLFLSIDSQTDDCYMGIDATLPSDTQKMLSEQTKKPNAQNRHGSAL